MADKTIKVKVDVETDVEPSIAQLKALKKQLKETAAGSEDFARLQQQIDDVQDSLASARTGAGNFTDVLGQLPGPIGAIGGQASGLITTLKQFGALKITNLQSSFVELGKDVTDIAKGFMDLTGITKVYTTLNAALSKSFIAVGIGEQAAAAGARAFAAALTATGIGALVVALGLLIANWDKVTDAITGATAESKTYEEAQASVTKELTDFNKQLIGVENSFKAARAGTISKQDALKQYNDTIGKTIGFAGSLEQAEELMATNTPVIIQSIKLRTQANVFYAKSAEAAAKAVAGEGVEPTFWESVGNYVKSGGNMAIFAGKQVTTLGENYADLSIKTDKFAKEGDKLTNEAIENDKKLKKGLAKPPDYSGSKKATNDVLNELKKGFEDARLTLLSEKDRELEQVRIKYDDLVAKAKKYGKDTAILEEARLKENTAIKQKFDKQEADRVEKANKETKDLADKVIKEKLDSETLQLDLRLAKGEISEKEYQQKLYEIRKQYALTNDDLIKAEIDRETFKNDEKKKLAEEERGIIATRLQTQIEALDAENARIEGDFQQDLERLAEKKALLTEQETNELANTELNEFQKTEIRKKYADARKNVSDQEIATEKAAAQAKHDINMAYLGLFEQFGNVLSQVAGKNKALAIAGIVISQAASIGQIIANTGIANAKAVAASPVTFGQPWVAINTISAGLSIASTIASAVKSIQQINQAASQAGVTGGGGGGSVGAAPNIPAPRVAGAAAPEIQTAGGQNPNTQLAETLGRASAPIKAYVVSGDVSSQQALDRRTSRAATFSGG
jgi:hypothetical protein